MKTGKRRSRSSIGTRKIAASTTPADLVATVGSSKRGMTPEDLFVRAGYGSDDPEDVARFYQALREAVQKGTLREVRLPNGDARIVASP